MENGDLCRAVACAALVFCFAAAGCGPCYGRQLEDQLGHRHRIDRGYLNRYGCESFDEVITAEDMIAWCVEHELGDTIAADVNPPCRPGETPGGCELYWVCEGPARGVGE